MDATNAIIPNPNINPIPIHPSNFPNGGTSSSVMRPPNFEQLMLLHHAQQQQQRMMQQTSLRQDELRYEYKCTMYIFVMNVFLNS